MSRIGRYELLRKIGRGGMAQVFLGRRRGPGGVEKLLAVKCIRPERTGDPRFVQMFVTEARLSMTMAHRNIVQVFDFGRAGEQLFLAMEYVEGVDLGTALAVLRKDGRTMDPLLAAFICLEACQALDYAHSLRSPDGQTLGIVHRDVTPRNVLLSIAGEVKLVDFGIATALDELASDGRVRGTPAYMSPEQSSGEQVDGRSDVFSLGLVLWETLAGKRAYAFDDSWERLRAARSAEVPPLPDTVPEALRAIVRRATAAEPDQRYSDARSMQLELDAFVIQARASGGGEPPTHRIAAWIRELLPTQSGQSPEQLDIEAEQPGDVVTFLEDGERGLAESLTHSTLVTAVTETGDTVTGDTVTRDTVSSDRAAPKEPRPAGVSVVMSGTLIVDGRTDSESATDRDTTGEPAPREPTVVPEIASGSPPAQSRRRWLITAALAAVVLAALGWGLSGMSSSEAEQSASVGAERGDTIGSPQPRADQPVRAVLPAVAPDGSPPAVAPDGSPPAVAPDGSPPAVAPDGSPPAVAPDGSPPAVAPDGSIDAAPVTAHEDSPSSPAEVDARGVRDAAVRPRPESSDNRPSRTRRTDAGRGAATASPAPSAAQVAHGTVKISATPWARVRVIGHSASCDETPCVLQLPPGTHRIHLVNPVAQLSKELRVSVASGQTKVVSANLSTP
ncbi:MAG: protein kinase [Myxococcota bacterium]